MFPTDRERSGVRATFNGDKGLDHTLDIYTSTKGTVPK